MIDSLVRIAIASDHAGFDTKEYLKNELGKSGYTFQDFGAFSSDSVDYPDVVHPLAKAVQDGTYRFGILICGSGNGVAMVANKYPGIRAALCWTEEIAKLARTHNDANIIALPARFITLDDSFKMALVFLTTDFEGGRHERRVEKINHILH